MALEGSLSETSYTFFWKRKNPEERRMHGVGFAIKTTLVNRYNLQLNTINERLMTLRVPLPENNYITLISVYAPTLDSDDAVKESFYVTLHNTIQAVCSRDKLFVLGDFNARVGQDHTLWKGIIGKQGVGSCNPNGLHLLGLCAENSLAISNTFFRLPNQQKTTWKHPWSKHWTILDYILTRSRYLTDILVTQSMPGADDCWTDHLLLISCLRIKLRNLSHNKIPAKRSRHFDVSSLKTPALEEKYSNRLSQLLNEAPSSSNLKTIEADWSHLCATIKKAAEEVVGFPNRIHQDWFDQNDSEIQQIIKTKRSAHLAWENRPTRASRQRFQEAKQECQRRIREIQNSWWQRKAEEMQSYADGRDFRRFYAATKEIYGP